MNYYVFGFTDQKATQGHQLLYAGTSKLEAKEAILHAGEVEGVKIAHLFCSPMPHLQKRFGVRTAPPAILAPVVPADEIICGSPAEAVEPVTPVIVEPDTVTPPGVEPVAVTQSSPAAPAPETPATETPATEAPAAEAPSTAPLNLLDLPKKPKR